MTDFGTVGVLVQQSFSAEQASALHNLERIGGPGRDRTDDLFHAMEARSQLRHRPTLRGRTLNVENQ